MKTVMKKDYALNAQPAIPRSSFNRSHGYKTTMDFGNLCPVYVDEVMPGDTFSLKATIFARLNTPIKALMDNMYFDVHYFYVPYAKVWDSFEDFISGKVEKTIPILYGTVCEDGNMTLTDYFGIPTLLTPVSTPEVSCLPYRAYLKIVDEWYVAKGVEDDISYDTGDGPDNILAFPLQKRRKRHDYITSCLPEPQLGESVELPLGTSAPVFGDGNAIHYQDALGNLHNYYQGGTIGNRMEKVALGPNAVGSAGSGNLPTTNRAIGLVQSGTSGMIADLSQATAATVNSLRQSIAIQQMLEVDARGGNRYIETIMAHFGVRPPDLRVNRAEYLGGSSSRINVTPVPQTSWGNASAGETVQGNISGYGTMFDQKGKFFKTFQEHGVIIGIASARADLTYQQGLDKMWSRQDRYDFPWPHLMNIGEQPVLSKEIYLKGETQDDDIFGYQPPYEDLRQKMSKITGKFRSNDPQSLDLWHLSQEFSTRPVLNSTFLEENPPIERVVEVPSEPDLIVDIYYNLNCVRPMPIHGIPGLRRL
jgi:hypothetical protein